MSDGDYKVIDSFINEFDSTISERNIKDTSLPRLPDPLYIDCGTQVNQRLVIECVNPLPEAKIIFAAFSAALNSSWFDDLAQDSKKSYKYALQIFLPWLNEQTKINSKTMKAYERDRKEIVKVTKVSLLIRLLKHGEEGVASNKEALQFITLLQNTKLAKDEDSEQYSLSCWFGRFGWIREYLGDECFLSLESPKVLIPSLQDLAASTLLYLHQANTSLEKVRQYHGVDFDACCVGTSEQKIVARQNIFPHIARFDNDMPDPLTNCLLCDWTSLLCESAVLHSLRTGEMIDMPRYETGRKMKLRQAFIGRTTLISIKYSSLPTPAEQILMAWILATLCVQAEDIPKLRKSNITISRKPNGKAEFISVAYYKTRASRPHDTPMVSANSLMGKAMLIYLDKISEGAELISLTSQQLAPNFSNVKNTRRSQFGALGVLTRVWLSEAFQSHFNRQSKKSLFLKAINAFQQEGTLCWENKGKHGESYVDYFARVKRPQPTKLFGLSSIKNSAVHARADRYRVGSLSNYNSHTSLTEQLDYLSESNKEWVNNVGRVLRFVLNDFEHYVYKHNIEDIDSEVRQLHALTKITQTKDSKINHLGYAKTSSEQAFQGQIVVIDSVDTAIRMIHYIDQANVNKDRLMQSCPSFFIRKVLVNVEWMYHTLIRLSKDYRKEAEKQYLEFKAYLPPLFEHHINGGIGA